MDKQFASAEWRKLIPIPVCEAYAEYNELYNKAWELAFLHIKDIPGMPQNPYMDEAFCDTQLWIWDTCFMALFCKYAQSAFPGVESLKNFYDVLYSKKKLPTVIPSEREPEWTGSVAGKPFEIQVHIADNPPLFAWAEYENAMMSGDKAHIKELLYDCRVLQKHYEWLENLHESVQLRGVYAQTCLIAEKYGYKWEGGRSGMDNTPRGRTGLHAEKQRPNNPDMLWVDAICQQALSAKMIANLFALVNDAENEAVWNDRFIEKKNIINEYYWDEEDSFYYDIDCNTHDFYKVMTIASYWALTAEVASDKQASALLQQVENPLTLGGDVPLISLARSDGDFAHNGEYWRGSLWLPTAYAALTGLRNYGFFKEAHTASCKVLKHMYKTYKEHIPHTIWECYAPEEAKPASNEHGSGKYVRQDFCGWSALGPISIYIEFVLGFHKVDAFNRVVEWAKPDTIEGKIGIRNLRFGEIITDIEAFQGQCRVTANEGYTLKINGKSYEILAGENKFDL